MTQVYIDKMTGFKATDANISCRGFQFEVGKWYDVPFGDIIKCGGNGFHFCPQPSGPWSYYPETGTRLWEIEAEQVLSTPDEPGSGNKKVCRRIRLVREIFPDGQGNTGDRNTGYWNTGDWNTGNYNTGDRNTGDRNTGNYNTGNYNTGYRNTGDGNATSHCSGFFCVAEPTVAVFDTQTGLTRSEFIAQYPEYSRLSWALLQIEDIDFAAYAAIPGITPEKLKILHQKHLKGRNLVE